MFQRPTPQNEEDCLNWLQLIRSSNLGPAGFWKVMARFKTAEAALDALPTLYASKKRAIIRASRSDVEQELARFLSLKGTLIDYGHPDYPPLLKQLEDAPPL